MGNNRIVANAAGTVVQRNSYYPFGMAYGEESDLEQGKQPYKYNGKELDKMHGLNQYDYEARYMDPASIRFTTVDPLAEKYYSISPYAYVANNPLNAVDLRGDSITVLNLNDGQHVALLIQNKNKKWEYFSINGDNVSFFGSHSGGRKFNDLAIGEFDSPQQFLESAYNSKGDKDDKSINSYEFSEGFVIPTTEEQDVQIKSSFIEIANNEEYRLNPLNPNQCATVVQRSLESGGIKTTQTMPNPNPFGSLTKEVRPYFPKTAFDVIKKNNPQGALIKKNK